MKDLSYDEFIVEVEKPIYEQSAKEIWDYTYLLFGEVIKALDVTRLGTEIIWCLEVESRYNLNISIFDVLKRKESELDAFFEEYFAKLLIKPTFYKPKFLIDNKDKLCTDNRLQKLLVFIEDISNKIGKDLFFLLDGGYYDKPEYDFFSNYGLMQIKKRINRETINNREIWVIKSYEGEKKDYILEDIAFIWPACWGMSRFLDKEGKWGFIDIVSYKRYYMPDYVYSMNDYKFDRAVYLDKRHGLYGYINYKGEIVIPPKYVDAMDFMNLCGETLAVVKFSMEEERKMRTDPDRKNIMGENIDMGITIFKDIITIDINGNFTRRIKEKYEEERRQYFNKINSEERKDYHINLIGDSEDEEDIMNALENGCGDIFGF